MDLETAVATSWPLLATDDRRAAAILAVRDRRTTPARLAARVHSLPRLAGRAELLELCRALSDGAQSEFEIWGLRNFFTPDLLAISVGQRRLQLGHRSIYIDRAFDTEMVAVELDGTRWHDRPEQRERDRRRDEALAALGWQVVRFSYWRLLNDPEGARHRLYEILAVRRMQMGLPSAG